jgi:hypothetical protein
MSYNITLTAPNGEFASAVDHEFQRARRLVWRRWRKGFGPLEPETCTVVVTGDSPMLGDDMGELAGVAPNVLSLLQDDHEEINRMVGRGCPMDEATYAESVRAIEKGVKDALAGGDSECTFVQRAAIYRVVVLFAALDVHLAEHQFDGVEITGGDDA